MPLTRQNQSTTTKPAREPHKCVPVHGEFGRYTVNSRSAEKEGKEEAYIVDVLQEEDTTAHGKVIGTCPCKGFSVRGTCSHLTDARAEHQRLADQLIDQAADKMGFTNYS